MARQRGQGESRRRTVRHRQGFTLIELLVGMLITSIILSAVAAFAFALSVATTASGDTAAKQAQLRQATVRLRDLVGTCKLLCAAPGSDLVIWREDDNNDNRINVNELVYIERGEACDRLRLCRFAAADNPSLTLAELALATTKAQLEASYGVTYTPLVPVCRAVQFAFYPAAPVTAARCLRISFGLTENGVDHPYEIVAALRGRAGHLLKPAGDALVACDDD
jgi:prepilin-type N-terminal cleavage/methylation domain-containing protein